MNASGPSRERRIIRDRAEVEYWVLELAVTLRIPLACLTSDRFAGLFNRRYDGFDRAELISCLERLLAAGEIDVTREGESLHPDRVRFRCRVARPRSRPMPRNPRRKCYPAWFRELEVWFRRPFSPEEP